MPASNPFEPLSSLPTDSDVGSANGDKKTNADEAHSEHSEINHDDADDDGIKDDVVVQDLELQFALWVRSVFRERYLSD